MEVGAVGLSQKCIVIRDSPHLFQCNSLRSHSKMWEEVFEEPSSCLGFTALFQLPTDPTVK